MIKAIFSIPAPSVYNDRMLKAISIINAHALTEGPLHFHSRMREELSRFGYDLELKNNAEIAPEIDTDGNLVIKGLNNPAFILYLDKDLYLSHALMAGGYLLFNNATSIRLCDDKMLTHMALADRNIKMPRTISAPLSYGEEIAEDFLARVAASLGFPLVAKENFGSLGKNVYLIKDFVALKAFEEEHHAKPRLYQEFISSSFGFDYRVIVIGGKAAAWMKRINKTGDFRSNIAQRASSEKVDLPAAYIQTAERAAAALKLDYCGIDLLEGKEREPLLCEVNSNAFLRGIESTTGINVAGQYAVWINDVLKGRATRF